MVLQVSLWIQDNAEMVLVTEIKVLEILKRAKDFQSGEGVSAFESETNVREEVNRRSYKAGYTDRDGQPKVSRQTSYSKGDACRPMNKKKYDEGYERAFGHK